MSRFEQLSILLFSFYGAWLVSDIISMEVEKQRYRKMPPVNLGVIRMRLVDPFSDVTELPEIKKDTSVN